MAIDNQIELGKPRPSQQLVVGVSPDPVAAKARLIVMEAKGC